MRKYLITFFLVLIILIVVLYITLDDLVGGQDTISSRDSSIPNVEDNVTSATNASVMKRAENLALRILDNMSSYGFSYFRVRLFVEPMEYDQWGNFIGNNISYTVELIHKIREANPDATIILDLHYSDTWADPGHQYKPREWSNISYPELVNVVYNYTLSVLNTLYVNNATPDMVQIGNEITCGFLWPDGRVCNVANEEGQWRKFTDLLKAGIGGVKDSRYGSRIKTIIHIDLGRGWDGAKWFFTKLKQYGVDYDIIGVSYYPWWHGNINELISIIRNLHHVFNKPVMVVETAYPHKPVNIAGMPYAHSNKMQWPMSPIGQERYLRDLIGNLCKVDGVTAVLWWEPNYIPCPHVKTWLNGATGLYDARWKPLPALRNLRNYLCSKIGFGGDVSTLLFLARVCEAMK